MALRSPSETLTRSYSALPDKAFTFTIVLCVCNKDKEEEEEEEEIGGELEEEEKKKRTNEYYEINLSNCSLHN